MTDTLRLGLPRIDAAQAQKHVTHNEALALLDIEIHLSVAERNRLAPPLAPTEGTRLLLGAAPTGSFAGQSGAVASFQDGAWLFVTPRTGWRAWIESESKLVVFDGTAWRDVVPDLVDVQNLRRLGLGTAADDANPLSLRLNGALLNAKPVAEGGTGDLRIKLNKPVAANTISQLYQTNFAGRAETGLIGDDRFRIKVSNDGNAWKDALVVDPLTGAVTFPNGSANLAVTASLTTGTGAAFVLTPLIKAAISDNALFWIVPHVPNATASGVDPTLQVAGVDAAPLPLKSHDGGSLAQGGLETGRAVLVRKSGATYRAQTRRTDGAVLNLIEDGGRFTGTTDSIASPGAPYVEPGYFAAQNGAVKSLFGTAVQNSSTYGGTGAALLPEIADLVGRIRPAAARLSGLEFHVMKVVAGSGTAQAETIQTLAHAMLFSGSRIVGRAQTQSVWFRVLSGSLVLAPADSNTRVLVDGVAHDTSVNAASRLFGTAQGWKHMQRWLMPADGITPAPWPFRVTPGTALLLALPCVVQGLETLPWDQGPVPAAHPWR